MQIIILVCTQLIVDVIHIAHLGCWCLCFWEYAQCVIFNLICMPSLVKVGMIIIVSACWRKHIYLSECFKCESLQLVTQSCPNSAIADYETAYGRTVVGYGRENNKLILLSILWLVKKVDEVVEVNNDEWKRWKLLSVNHDIKIKWHLETL